VDTRRAVIVAFIVVIVASGAIVSIEAFFANVQTAPDGTYSEIAGSIQGPSHANVTNGAITLKVNNLTDASNPAARDIWAKLNNQSNGSFMYNHTLVPPAGEQYLIANVTVTNVAHRQEPFSYADFFLVAKDGRIYYANYAVCGAYCSANVLQNRTLSSNFTGDLYVLFSIPATSEATKLVYGSSPPIVVTVA
jgi:hypothetical protein